jgi:hypothetical protein
LERLSAWPTKPVAERITDPSAQERIQPEMSLQAEVTSID